jgi:hypothetical protein
MLMLVNLCTPQSSSCEQHVRCTQHTASYTAITVSICVCNRASLGLLGDPEVHQLMLVSCLSDRYKHTYRYALL